MAIQLGRRSEAVWAGDAWNTAEELWEEVAVVIVVVLVIVVEVVVAAVVVKKQD